MVCRAWFARRSPPRESRWRVVLPEEAGTGAVPHSAAKDALAGETFGVAAGGDQELCRGGDTDAV
jgi:hypothetical protein